MLERIELSSEKGVGNVSLLPAEAAIKPRPMGRLASVEPGAICDR